MPDPHELIAAALREQAAAERRLHGAVQAARDAGWSWTQVAEVLGVTRQAAHRRFHAAPAVALDDGGARGDGVPADVAAENGPGGASDPWAEARAAAEATVEAWLRGDVAAVHARMTSVARAGLPQSALRGVLLEIEDLSGGLRAVRVTGVHDLDGELLSGEPASGGPSPGCGAGRAGRRRAVVVRCVAAGEDADPVVHVLIGPGGRVSGLSVRISDELEQWPL
ncbi:helix-turn-helix transcriptional regulator [Micrococcus porci]|uniref:helix-turn-helix transcriptional regulator n=1 Tax=Micrococcus porci TaxID=2856555 RepID=UPI003CF62898